MAEQVTRPYVRAWCKMMGSFAPYTETQVAKAEAEGAPADAIYRLNGDGGWATFDTVTVPGVRRRMVELLADFRVVAEVAASVGPWLRCAQVGDLTEAQWEMAAHALWRCRPSSPAAWMPPTFVQRLFDAVAVADLSNRERLAKGFPEYVGFWQELSAGFDRVDALEQSVAAHYAVPAGGG